MRCTRRNEVQNQSQGSKVDPSRGRKNTGCSEGCGPEETPQSNTGLIPRMVSKGRAKTRVNKLDQLVCTRKLEVNGIPENPTNQQESCGKQLRQQGYPKKGRPSAVTVGPYSKAACTRCCGRLRRWCRSTIAEAKQQRLRGRGRPHSSSGSAVD